MFGSLGGPELLFLFVLALLLFGPRRLPEVGRLIGKTVSEFRRATYEFRANLEREVELENLRDARKALEAEGQETSGAVRAAADDALRGPVAREPAAPGAPGRETDSARGGADGESRSES